MTRNGTVFCLGGTFGNHHRIADLALASGSKLLGGSADRAMRPQTPRQLMVQPSPTTTELGRKQPRPDSETDQGKHPLGRTPLFRHAVMCGYWKSMGVPTYDRLRNFHSLFVLMSVK